MANTADNVDLQFERGIDKVLALAVVLSYLCEVDEFERWFRRSGLQIDNLTLPGFRFAFQVVSRRLVDELIDNISLGLSHDRILDRAAFHGVQLGELPDSCEKTILLKNLYAAASHVCSAQDWPSLVVECLGFRKSMVEPFIALKHHAIVNELFNVSNVDEALRCAAMFELYIFFNDTSRGLPHGYPQSTLSNDLWRGELRSGQVGYLESVFPGYSRAIQYVWHRLGLGGEAPRSWETMRHARSWDEFDQSFEALGAEVVTPVEERLGRDIGLVPMLLLRDASPNNALGALMSKPPASSPPTQTQVLERAFLWYNIELIDSSHETVFNGPPAFMSALAGLVELKQRRGGSFPVEGIKLVHPETGGGHSFSFGLLMDVTSVITDASGWLLFLDCCYDYGRNGRASLAEVGALVDRYAQSGKLSLTELEVNRNAFLKCMRDWLISPTKNEFLESRRAAHQSIETGEQLQTARGLLVELLAYYRLADSSVANHKTEWSYKRNKLEIDVLERSGNQLRFVECKKPADALEVQADKLLRKVRTLTADEQFRAEWGVSEKTVPVLELVVWESVPAKTVADLERSGVFVVPLPKLLRADRRLARVDTGRVDVVFRDVRKRSRSADTSPDLEDESS